VRIGSSLDEAAAFEPLNHARDRGGLDAEPRCERCLPQARFLPDRAEQCILPGMHAVCGQQIGEMGTVASRETLQRRAERCRHLRRR
jgi:hypothetical protein